MPAAYPILLNVSSKRIVIIGGGHVGLRKATKLVEAGATDITVVSPAFTEGFPPSVHKVKAEYQPVHLAGAVLVFAATDSAAVNAAVVREARHRNILATRADEESGDFSAGAALHDQNLTIAVWADSPALAAAVRDGLKSRLDPRWAAMAQAMQSLRPMILSSGLPPEKRRLLFRELAGEPAMSKLADGGIDALREWIENRKEDLSIKDSKELEQ